MIQTKNYYPMKLYGGSKRSAIVIGGGVNGLLSAFELNKSGWRVQLIDGDSIPNRHAASYGKHRIIHPMDEAMSLAGLQHMNKVLALWHAVLKEIGSNVFLNTGFIGVNTNNTKAEYRSSHCKTLFPNTIARYLPLLHNGKFNEAFFFSEYGIILADVFLSELSKYLKCNGVLAHANQKVSSLDTSTASVQCESGLRCKADRLVVAAGTGTRKLLMNDHASATRPDPVPFSSKRCYVLYLKENHQTANKKTYPAWVCSGKDNLWGIPGIQNIETKLGCGAFTHDCIPSAPSLNSKMITNGIKHKHNKQFPAIKTTSDAKLSFNHWTLTNREDYCYRTGKAVVVVSDSGSGFKQAPYTAKQVRDTALV